jgi:hypothetical protein
VVDVELAGGVEVVVVIGGIPRAAGEGAAAPISGAVRDSARRTSARVLHASVQCLNLSRA